VRHHVVQLAGNPDPLGGNGVRGQLGAGSLQLHRAPAALLRQRAPPPHDVAQEPGPGDQAAEQDQRVELVRSRPKQHQADQGELDGGQGTQREATGVRGRHRICRHQHGRAEQSSGETQQRVGERDDQYADHDPRCQPPEPDTGTVHDRNHQCGDGAVPGGARGDLDGQQASRVAAPTGQRHVHQQQNRRPRHRRRTLRGVHVRRLGLLPCSW